RTGKTLTGSVGQVKAGGAADEQRVDVRQDVPQHLVWCFVLVVAGTFVLFIVGTFVLSHAGGCALFSAGTFVLFVRNKVVDVRAGRAARLRAADCPCGGDARGPQMRLEWSPQPQVVEARRERGHGQIEEPDGPPGRISARDRPPWSIRVLVREDRKSVV